MDETREKSEIWNLHNSRGSSVFHPPPQPHQAPHSQHYNHSPSRRVTRMVVLSSVVKLPVDNDDPTLLEGLKGPQVWGRRVTGESGKV